MSESEEPLLLPARGPASVAPAAASSASGRHAITGAPPPPSRQQQARRVAAAGGGDEEASAGTNPTRPPRRWKGSLLFPCGTSYESLGVCCAVGSGFPCPLLWPCVFSHSHGRLLAPLRAARLLTFVLFSLFVFVPWVVLRVPLSVARAQACAPLADTGGRGIPRADVVECLRLIEADDVVFWVSVGLTAGALVAAGLLRFAVRRRLRVEGGGCCGRGGGGRRSAATNDGKGQGFGQGSSPSSPPSSPLRSLLAAGAWLFADVLTWLLCPACALCQEARSAAAWERDEKRGEAATGAGGGGQGGGSGGGGDEEEEQSLLLEAPAVPPAFDRGGGEMV